MQFIACQAGTIGVIVYEPLVFTGCTHIRGTFGAPVEHCAAINAYLACRVKHLLLIKAAYAHSIPSFVHTGTQAFGASVVVTLCTVAIWELITARLARPTHKIGSTSAFGALCLPIIIGAQ